MRKSWFSRLGEQIIVSTISLTISIALVVGLVVFLVPKTEKDGIEADMAEYQVLLEDKKVLVRFSPCPFVPSLGMADTTKPVWNLLREKEKEYKAKGLPPMLAGTTESVVRNRLYSVTLAEYDSSTTVLRRDLQKVLDQLEIKGTVYVSPVSRQSS